MPWESFASRFHVADLLRARPLEASRQLFRAGSRIPLPYPDLHNESLSVPRAELQSWNVTPYPDN